MKLHKVRKIFFLFLAFFLMLVATRAAFATLTSTNWAGYVVVANDVTAISASWTVPPIQCTTAVGQTSVSQGIYVWIGFDGWNNAIMPEQVGTGSNCLNGTASYYAWEYDNTLRSTYALSAFTSEIYAEDHMTASINYLGNNHYVLKISDTTQDLSRTYTITIPNTPRTSAEWIAEVALNINTQQQLILPGFQPITFTDCSASVNNVAGSIIQNNGQPLNMVDNNGNILVSPENLNQAGTSFQVTEVSP